MPLDPSRLMGVVLPRREVLHGDRETLHYALATGFGATADPADLPFVQEQGLRVVPSLATMLAFDDSWLPAAGIELRQVVHGALDLRFHRLLAPSGRTEATARILGLGDKGAGRGGLVHHETELAQAGELACSVLSTVFVRGGGGFGGDVGLVPEVVAAPAQPPAATAEVPTTLNQALWFRLLGDRNPLHADPEVARAAGFAGPILHGACTFGIACAEALRRFCGRDPARLARFAARFAGPLYPGETLRFAFWPEAGRVLFRAEARERGAIVLDNGLMELRG